MIGLSSDFTKSESNIYFISTLAAFALLFFLLVCLFWFPYFTPFTRLQAAVQSCAGADMELGGVVIDLKKKTKKW